VGLANGFNAPLNVSARTDDLGRLDRERKAVDARTA
jgi:hypothetical protein